MSNVSISRRHFLGRTVVGLAVLGSGAASLAACGGEEAPAGPNCANPPNLQPAETQQRTSLAYVDHATDPNKQCQRCTFFTAGAGANACGTCALNLGPVSPLGTCNSFAPKT